MTKILFLFAITIPYFGVGYGICTKTINKFVCRDTSVTNEMLEELDSSIRKIILVNIDYSDCHTNIMDRFTNLTILHVDPIGYCNCFCASNASFQFNCPSMDVCETISPTVMPLELIPLTYEPRTTTTSTPANTTETTALTASNLIPEHTLASTTVIEPPLKGKVFVYTLPPVVVKQIHITPGREIYTYVHYTICTAKRVSNKMPYKVS